MNRKILLAVAIVVIIFTVIAVILLLSGPRMRKQPSIRAFETTMALPPVNSEFYSYNALNAEDIIVPESTTLNLNKGKIFYGYYCVFCHGENGRGNGPVGQSYVPRPSDLSADSIMFFSAAELYRRSFKGTGHEPVMERVVPEEFRKFILTYIRYGFKE